MTNSVRPSSDAIRTGTRALKDPTLFRQQGYIDGAWVDAGHTRAVRAQTSPLAMA